ncbi:TRAP transporter small permease [Amphritea sp. 1_MG-2023]|uniref:TRAP transporter small permease subunit n=1 Tax=Amphritea sp. 1_MG-2023 TaxID=3062670 RepID=UPI0026E364C4|nr:TRAP transporter small permease [Amphritea sp. 1_MG-2023]MDO6564540.1 TRAP transporter small permease [Amphritea sp. 1_MG-2023]
MMDKVIINIYRDLVMDSNSNILKVAVNSFICFASWLSKAGAVLAMLLMAGMTLHVILEILLRAFFDSSTFILDEFVGYGVAAMTFMALGYTFETNTLIRVNILLTRVRSKLGRQIIEFLCVSTAFSLTSFIFMYFWKSVIRNYERGSTSETLAEVPLWIPEAFVLFGLSIFIIQMLAYFLRIVSGQPLLSEQD